MRLKLFENDPKKKNCMNDEDKNTEETLLTRRLTEASYRVSLYQVKIQYVGSTNENLVHREEKSFSKMDLTFGTRKPVLKYCLPYMIFILSYAIVHSTTTLAFVSVASVKVHYSSTYFLSEKPDDEAFETDNNDADDQNISSQRNSISILDMNTFKVRKNKFMLQNQQQRWYQPPNPLLEDPVEFVQAILVALQERKKYGPWNGALCLLESSTPSWRRLLLKSVGAPPDAENDQVAPSLQSALERSNNQFAILTTNLDEESTESHDFTTALRSIQKCWNFPSDPVIFEEDENDGKKRTEGERIIDTCWIESRLRSPKDNTLLAVVGWSLQRRQIVQEDEGSSSNAFGNNTNNLTTCWLLDGIDWQDFRDEFRPGIGREEWERICG